MIALERQIRYFWQWIGISSVTVAFFINLLFTIWQMCTTGISLPAVVDNNTPLDLSVQPSVYSSIDQGTHFVVFNTLKQFLR